MKARITIKVGAKKDGTITAVEARVVLSNLRFPVFGVVHHLIENTRIPHIHGKLVAVQINKGHERSHPVRTKCQLSHPHPRSWTT